MPSGDNTKTPEWAAANVLRGARVGTGAERALKALVDLAGLDADLGTCEQPRGSNRGPLLAKFFVADDYDPSGPGDSGYPWCASGVCHWVQFWLEFCPEAKRLFGHIKPPRTARAFGLQEWGEGPARSTVQVIAGSALRSNRAMVLPGDIVVFDFSHCGIAASQSKSGLFTCIEGNTDKGGSREGWQVARRPRGISGVRCLVRLIPKGLPV